MVVKVSELTVPASKAPATGPLTTAAEQARRYIAQIPPVAEGERNQCAYRVAAILTRDFGLSVDEAYPLLLEWNGGNSPPLPEREIGSVLRSSKKNGKYIEGSKAPPPKPQEVAAKILQQPVSESLELMAVFEAERDGLRKTPPLPWPRLSDRTAFLRPGAVSILGGPPCRGKSLFCLNTGMELSRQGVTWTYIPMEDPPEDYQRRILACITNDWGVISDDKFTAEARIKALNDNMDAVREVSSHFVANPKLPKKREDGTRKAPVVSPDFMLSLLWEALKKSRVVFVDPWCQISFSGQGMNKWEAEEEFTQQLVGLPLDTGGTIVIVMHTKNLHGTKGRALDGESLQGSSTVNRLAKTVVMMEMHDMKASEVRRPQEATAKVEHDYTITVSKARNSYGGGSRLAFSLPSPKFVEHGVIVPKKKKESGDDVWGSGF